uniref:Uncharacterized protein n=1 Tax=Anguilla anguilla TaxID=7936 RepID=A0A0E9QJM5_ANGAN
MVLSGFITDFNLDILCFTETTALNEVAPAGYM